MIVAWYRAIKIIQPQESIHQYVNPWSELLHIETEQHTLLSRCVVREQHTCSPSSAVMPMVVLSCFGKQVNILNLLLKDERQFNVTVTSPFMLFWS